MKCGIPAVAAAVWAVMAMVALGGAARTDTREHTQPGTPGAKPGTPAERYVCPMRCEGDKVYDSPGKCPVCHMKLEQVAPAAWTLTITPTRTPEAAGGGTRASLKFEFAAKKAGDKRPPDGPFDVVFVSADLRWMGRLRGAMKGGAFEAPFTFPSAGNYLVLGEVTGVDAGAPTIARTGFIVYSGTMAHVSQADESMVPVNASLKPDLGQEKEADHHRVKLSGLAEIVGGAETALDVSGLEKSPESHARLVVISQDGKQFLDVAPDSPPGSPGAPSGNAGTRGGRFVVRFPSAGMYRVFVELSAAGSSTSIPFAVEVKEAKPAR